MSPKPRSAFEAEAIEVFGNAPDIEPVAHSALATASVVHDLGNLIQIAASAINIVSRTPAMPAIHSGPILARATASLEQAGAIVRQTVDRIRDRASGRDGASVQACLADVAALIGATGEPGLTLTLEIDLAPDLPRLRCDPVGLRRAVLNLVFNARDAMAGSGIILLRARAFPHGPGAIGVELGVTDKGKGMSPATIARAFDPFFTTKQDGLSGIGLPMVDRFVRDAGGEIVVESEPGAGTTVTMRLPAIPRPPGGGASAAPEFISEESDR